MKKEWPVPKVNVYLPDDLAEAVRAAAIPVSSVCQRALEEALRTVGAVRESTRRPPGDVPTNGVYGRLTDRARDVLTLSGAQARDRGHAKAGTEHLLLGLLAEGGNLGLRVLDQMGVDPADVQTEMETAMRAIAAAETPVERPPMTSGCVWTVERAMQEALKLGHNHIGCEHFLIALAAEEKGLAGHLLRGMGVEPTVTRRAVNAAAAALISFRPNLHQVATDYTLRQILKRLDGLEQRLAG